MSSCGCNPTSSMTHPLISGFMMGGAIYALDIMLRPRFAANTGMELALFLIEGAACDVVYSMIGRGSRGIPGLSSAFDNVSLMKSLLAGGTIWITDMFLGVDAFAGFGSEIMKFFLQGFIVYFVLGTSVNLG